MARFNQLNEATTKIRERKDFYKNETVSLSGSLSDNRDALVDANRIIKELEKEANELAESIGLDKNIIFAVERSDSNDTGDDTQMFHLSRRWIMPMLECGLMTLSGLDKK